MFLKIGVLHLFHPEFCNDLAFVFDDNSAQYCLVSLLCIGLPLVKHSCPSCCSQSKPDTNMFQKRLTILHSKWISDEVHNSGSCERVRERHTSFSNLSDMFDATASPKPRLAGLSGTRLHPRTNLTLHLSAKGLPPTKLQAKTPIRGVSILISRR